MNWNVWGPPLVVMAIGLVAGVVLARKAKQAKPADATPQPKLETKKATLLDEIRTLDANHADMDEAEYTRLRDAKIDAAAQIQRALAEDGVLDNEERDTDPGPTAATPATKTPSKWKAPIWAAGLIAFFAVLSLLLTQATQDRPSQMGDAPSPQTQTTSPEVLAAQTVLLENPNDLDALNIVTYDALMRRDFQAAMQTIDTARAVNPHHPDVLTHLGILQMTVGMFDRAEVSMTSARAADPTATKPVLWGAIVRLQTDDRNGALALLALAEGLELNEKEQEMRMALMAQAQSIGVGAPSSAAATSAAPTVPAASQAAMVSGTLSWGTDGATPTGGVVFLFAKRSAQQAGPPLAAKRFGPEALPTEFSLGVQDMIMGGEWPEQVWIQARWDADGNAGTKSPDDRTSTIAGPIAPETADIEIVLAE